jgi:uncharacterized protein
MKTPKKYLVMLCFIFIFSGLTACFSEEKKLTETDNTKDYQVEESKSPEGDQTTNDETKEEPGSRGFLWKTSHNGTTVYMLGSIHVATEDFYPLHNEIENAFQQSQYVAVEADIVNGNVFETQRLIDQKGTYPEEETLQDNLPEELYDQLEVTLEEYGVPMKMVERYEPWYVFMLLDGLQTIQLGYDSTLGIDYHFLSEVREDQEIIELESVEFQLNLFDQFSQEIQEDLLESSLTAVDSAKEDMKKMAELWRAGDEEGLEELLFHTESESETDQIFMEELLDKRNIGMTDKIEGFLSEGNQETYLVIVGTAHYFGEKGIVKLLEDRGYKVEKVL